MDESSDWAVPLSIATTTPAKLAVSLMEISESRISLSAVTRRKQDHEEQHKQKYQADSNQRLLREELASAFIALWLVLCEEAGLSHTQPGALVFTHGARDAGRVAARALPGHGSAVASHGHQALPIPLYCFPVLFRGK
eukprot:6212167-Pleurochrysis_carterae.AAC.8